MNVYMYIYKATTKEDESLNLRESKEAGNIREGLE